MLLSLLAVAGAQTFLAQGQVRLTGLQAEVQAAQTKRLDLELQIANEEQPSAVMAAARQLGLIVPSEITDLPAVTLPSSSSSTTRTKPVSKVTPGNRPAKNSTQDARLVSGAATGNRSSGAP